MEKKRARIPTAPRRLTHPPRRGALKRDSVQTAKAVKPTNNAQVFTPNPMPRFMDGISVAPDGAIELIV